jgi:hypothetical protein
MREAFYAKYLNNEAIWTAPEADDSAVEAQLGKYVKASRTTVGGRIVAPQTSACSATSAHRHQPLTRTPPPATDTHTVTHR